MMDFLRRLMYGRYGNDQLNSALLALAIVLSIVGWVTHWGWLSALVMVLLVLCYCRMLSRNIRARYAENQKFMQWWGPISRRIADARVRFADRKTHRYFKCPQCKKRLRVPKGRGKINITCPNCRNQFIRKS